MRTFRVSYSDKREGRKQKQSKWFYVDFIDHIQKRRKIPVYVTSKGAAESVAKKIQSLVNAKLSKSPLEREIEVWLQNEIHAKLKEKLIDIGLIEGLRKINDIHLSEYLKQFQDSIIIKCKSDEHAKAKRTKHAIQTANRVKKVFTGCGFTRWNDLNLHDVQQYLESQRQNPKVKFSDKTYNYFIRELNSFCAFMLKKYKVGRNPLRELEKIDNPDEDGRGAFTPDEFTMLLKVTYHGPIRHALTGPERAFIYRFGVESGYRKSAINSLRVKDFDLDKGIVTLKAIYAKNGKPQPKPLWNPETILRLRAMFAGKHPQAKAFPEIPHHAAEMLQKDMAAAGIPNQDHEGNKRTFHSLKHTAASVLLQSGVSIKTAQRMLEHSKADLTVNTYTHFTQDQYMKELREKMPCFDLPDDEAMSATGTDGGNPAVLLLSQIGEQQRILTHNNGQNGPVSKKGCQTQVLDSPTVTTRGRRDSNPQPPDRQSDTLSN